MESIWNQNEKPPVFPALSQDIQTEAVIIGGGICGVLTAYFLQREGFQVVLLEANKICSGQTHLTTAKITCQHGLIYHRLVKQQGFLQAKCYADANRQAVSAYEELIQDLSIPCFFERLPSYLYTSSDEGRKKLLEEKNALLSLGVDCSMHTRQEYTALRIDQQAQFHPLMFLYSLASQLQVYEHTRVMRVKGNVVYTETHKVMAKHIIFACHFPFPVFPGGYFLKMHQDRSYVVAVKGKHDLPPGMFYGIDAGTPSLRSFQDILLVGGEGHRTGKKHALCRYESLKAIAEKRFPGTIPIAQWSAQDCMTLDGVPYIGRFSPLEPDWYVASGFQKWGMSLSMAGAQLLTDLLCRRSSPCESLFSPKRHWNTAAWKAFLGEMKQASLSLSASFLLPGQKIQAEELPHETGCIARLDSRKTGIYKDADNQLHFTAPRCPHLGCQLNWNPEDKTWDCPCHGSRFHRTGEIIDGPAQNGIGRPR